MSTTEQDCIHFKSKVLLKLCSAYTFPLIRSCGPEIVWCALTCSMRAWGEWTKMDTFSLGEDSRQSCASVALALYVKAMLLANFPSYNTCLWCSAKWISLSDLNLKVLCGEWRRKRSVNIITAELPTVMDAPNKLKIWRASKKTDADRLLLMTFMYSTAQSSQSRDVKRGCNNRVVYDIYYFYISLKWAKLDTDRQLHMPVSQVEHLDTSFISVSLMVWEIGVVQNVPLLSIGLE